MSNIISKILASQEFVSETVHEARTEVTKEIEEKVIEIQTTVGEDTDEKIVTALTEAKGYTDTAVANLVGSAPETLNTIQELAVAFEEHQDVTEALDAAITNKANASDLASHSSNKSNPHSVTTSQLGLSYETWTFTLDDNSTVTKKVVVM